MKWLFSISVVLLGTLPAKADSCSAVECVQIYAAHYHVPSEFIAALIDVESGWNPRAVSPKGAMGLMQLMPVTARRFGAFAPFDVEENIAAGTRYVTVLMWEFHGDLRLVAAAYYAGENQITARELKYRNADVVAYVRSVRRHYMLRLRATSGWFRRPLP
jgi:soluble lytic murein transglycosylase